jgi:peptidoglycan/xylan/chitin deacetylase (PgdA/CDA1 family)
VRALSHLGRAGAGALAVLAALALTQAATSGALRGTGTSLAAGADLSARTTQAIAEQRPVPDVAPGAATPAPAVALPAIPIGRQAIRVPMLMYHYIRVNPVPGDQLGFNLSVTPNDFGAQMDWLAANHYHPVDLKDVRAYFAGQAPLPSKPVVITLDDGYKDLYTTAYPILLAHHFKAVAYIVAGFLGAPNNVNRDQVVEMSANGIEIASHTVSHVDLTKTPDGELQRQLNDARADLEALVGKPVLDFAYPAGRYDGRVIAAVKAAGYQTATTTEPGVEHAAGDRFAWTRVRVSGGENLPAFVQSLGQPEATEELPASQVEPVERTPYNPLSDPKSWPSRLRQAFLLRHLLP